MLGVVKDVTKSYENGILFLAVSMSVSATILLTLGLGRREPRKPEEIAAIEEAEEALPEPM